MTTAARRGEFFLDLGEAGLKFTVEGEGEGKHFRKEIGTFNRLQKEFDRMAENLDGESAEPIDMAAIFGNILTEAASFEQQADKIPCFLLLNRVLIALHSDVRYRDIYPVLNDALTRVQELALQVR